MGPPVKERAARVPIVPLVVGALVLLASLAILVVGGRVTGVSWDEPYRIGKLANYFASGWFVDDVKDGVPLDFNAYVYAPVSDLLSHALGVLSGVQQWTQAAVTPEAYAVRHLAIGLMAVAAMAAAGALAALLLGSWRWAVVVAALLGSIPLWTGHAMFNSSDVPVATGYTLATLGVVLLARSVAAGAPWRAVTSGSALLGVGVLLSVGTRPATWPALLLSCALAVVAAAILASPASRVRSLLRIATGVVAAVAVASVVLVLVYPRGFGSPLTLLRESVAQSAKFGGTQPEAEQTRSLLEAAGYLPSWLAIQLPLVVAALVLVGLVGGVVLVVRVVARRDQAPDAGWRAVTVVALAAQLLVLPAGAALMRSNVYDGVRQFLFIVPVLAVFAGLGVATLLLLAGRLSRGAGLVQGAVWLLVALGVLLPVIDQVRLFPYGYAYVNEAASREPIDGRLPTDYWRTSMRELIPHVPAAGATSCTFDPLILGLVPIDCAAQGQLSPFWDTRGSEALDVPVPDGRYLYLESNRGRVDPGPGCTVLDRVTRTLHGQEVVMSYVALCEAPCVVQEAATCAGKSLSGAILDGLTLRDSNFAGADFTGTSLILADVSGSNFAGADLTGAILASTNLRGADLTGANLTNANLTGADLTDANLTNANLTGADLTDAIGLAAPAPAG
jgi:hypothetical protein